MKENWRAWHSSLTTIVSRYSSVDPAGCVREVSGSLLVFCLLFVQVSREGEDVGVDLLPTYRASFGTHDAILSVMDRI